MNKKINMIYLLIIFLLIISGCASEQFERNGEIEESTQQTDQLASRTVQQNMFDSALTAPLDEDETESILEPDDLISLSVLESEKFNTETRVSSEGHITLPVLDQVEVLGLTATEAEEKIEQLLKGEH
ncbi:MAG: hypothetical protein D3908_05075, partial [Candidatus Electrothrix sp. AUS4]|nr:hypothetical protein [Candidatus Electrothrix sp. AUS4]